MTKKKEAADLPAPGDKIIYVPHADYHGDRGVAGTEKGWKSVVVEGDGGVLMIESEHPGGGQMLQHPLTGEAAVPHDAEGGPHSWHYPKES